MNVSYSTLTLLSFYEFLDNYLLQRGQMYTNSVSRLYQQADTRLGAGYTAYSSPFRSFVWDSGVSGAQIFNSVSGYFFDASAYTTSGTGNVYTGVFFPQVSATAPGSFPLEIDFNTGSYISLVSGVGVQSGNSIFFTDSIAQTGVVRVSGSGSNTYTDISYTISGTPIVITRGEYGMTTDFENGRAIFPVGTLPANAIISGSYSFKDFNLYFANQGAESLVFSNKYYLNSRFARPITGIPPPYNFVTPCIFISLVNTKNEQRALGGLYDTKQELRLNVMAETLGQVENVHSLLAQAQDLTFPQLSRELWPLNPMGDYKSGYNYTALYAQYAPLGNNYSITKVRSTKISDSTAIDESVFLGEVSITIDQARTIR